MEEGHVATSIQDLKTTSLSGACLFERNILEVLVDLFLQPRNCVLAVVLAVECFAYHDFVRIILEVVKHELENSCLVQATNDFLDRRVHVEQQS